MESSLFIVTGPSGAGKTTALQEIIKQTKYQAAPYVALDSDVLWDNDLYSSVTDHSSYFNRWIALCHEIGKTSNKPVMLFGAGLIPGNIDDLEAALRFDHIHYFALVSEATELRTRLRARAQQGNVHDDGYIKEHTQFNQWFLDQANEPASPVTTFTTTHVETDATVAAINQWFYTIHDAKK